MRCYAEGVRHREERKRTVLDFDKASSRKGLKHEINIIYIFFFGERSKFISSREHHPGNIFTSGAATRENITDGVHPMK